jgi:hypothetical protein
VTDPKFSYKEIFPISKIKDMKKSIIIFNGLLLVLFLLSCQGQKVKKNKGVVNQVSDTSSNVIDSIEIWPFEIKRKTMYSVLPDSLGGKKAKGIAGLSVNINEKGKVEFFTIIKLSIIKGDRQLIDFCCGNSAFVARKDYPSNILRYYPFFEKYVDSLKIVPFKGGKPKRKNIFDFMIRF